MQKKKKSYKIFQMKYKIIVMLLVFSIIPIIVTGSSSYNISKNILWEKLEKTSTQTTKEISRGLDHYISGMTNLLKMIAQDINVKEANNTEYFQFAKNLVYNAKKTDDSIINIFIGTESGMFYTEPHSDLPSDFNHKTREWYIEAIRNKEEITITEPYIDTASGNLVVTLATSIYKGQSLIGVVGIDLELSALSNDLSNIVLGDSGYMYVVTENGIMITHPDTTQIGSQSVKEYEFWNDVSTNKEGFLEFENKNEKMFATYTTSEASKWKIIGIMSYDELSNDTSAINRVIQLVLIITFIVSIIAALLFAQPIGTNASNLAKALIAFAQGDTDVKVSIKSSDEFALIGKRFNDMTDKISNLIEEVNQVSTQVLQSSLTLSQVSEETSSSLSEVSRAVDEVSQGAMVQASSALDGVSSMNVLSQNITVIDEATSSMERLAMDATDITNLGLKRVEELMESSTKTKESTSEVSRLVYETNESMKQISAISNTIDEITAQTNLLALNASIEAARAGESGKGFAVVANEIRSLAEQSKNSTIRIKNIIDDISNKAKLSVSAMDTSNHSISEQLQTVEETREIFAQIMESVQILLHKSGEIKKSSDEVVEKNNSVLEQIEYISSISEESASAAEEVTASTEQITMTMDEITKQASLLNGLSYELNERMEQFKKNRI